MAGLYVCWPAAISSFQWSPVHRNWWQLLGNRLCLSTMNCFYDQQHQHSVPACRLALPVTKIKANKLYIDRAISRPYVAHVRAGIMGGWMVDAGWELMWTRKENGAGCSQNAGWGRRRRTGRHAIGWAARHQRGPPPIPPASQPVLAKFIKLALML